MDNEKDLLPIEQQELENKLLDETDSDEIGKIINIFNLNIKKKDVIRAAKLNEVQDKAVEQIAKRLEKKPDEFSNKDLLDYYKAIKETLKDSTAPTDIPQIQVNQNIINVESSQELLDRDARDRVLDAVQAILGNALRDEASQDAVIDVEAKKVEEE